MRTNLFEIVKNIDMVIFNNITEIDPELEVEIERDLDEEDGEEYIEYYQYFAINESDGRYLAELLPYDFSLFYSPLCDLYILGVQHIGTSWTVLEREI